MKVQRRPQLPRELLDKLFTVDCENGKIYWKGCRYPSKNGTEAGRVVKHDPSGRSQDYWELMIGGRGGKNYKRSHLIFFYSTGQWPRPGLVIDHIDNDSLNDRANNLREISAWANSMNRINTPRTNQRNAETMEELDNVEELEENAYGGRF